MQGSYCTMMNRGIFITKGRFGWNGMGTSSGLRKGGILSVQHTVRIVKFFL